VSKSVGRWAEAVRETRRLKDLGGKVLGRWRHRRLTGAMGHWSEWVTTARQFSLVANTLTLRHVYHELVFRLQFWFDAVLVRKEFVRALAMVAVRVNLSSERRFFEKWRASSRERVWQRFICQRIQSFLVCWQTREYFARWKHLMDFVLLHRVQGRIIHKYHLAQLRRIRLKCSWSIQFWCLWAMHARMIKHHIKCFRKRYYLHDVSSVFDAWRFCAKISIRFDRVRAVIGDRYQSSLLSKAWVEWHRYVMQKITAKAQGLLLNSQKTPAKIMIL